jgi:hypothetical protein
MSLPRDIARCPGAEWEPFGVQPYCLDCARRQQDDDESLVWIDPPDAEPCPMRLERAE